MLGHMAYTQMSFLSWDSHVGSPKIPKIETSATLEAHNFLGKALFEVKSKAKL
jgi:hypothetical protein